MQAVSNRPHAHLPTVQRNRIDTLIMEVVLVLLLFGADLALVVWALLP